MGVVWSVRLGILFGAVIAWEWASSTGVIDPFFWGRPTGIAKYLQIWASNQLLSDLTITLQEAFYGLVLGATGGVLLGIWLGLSPFWRAVFQPYIDLANSTPRIALAPLFLLWLGIGMASKVGVVVSIVFFIMVINTQEGVAAIHRDQFRLLQILGSSGLDRVRYIVLPASLAWIKAGLRLSIPYAIAGAVIGEFVAANSGLGYRLVQEAGILNANGTLAVVVLLAILGATMSAISNALLSEKTDRRN